MIGLVAALSAVFLKVGSGLLGTWRVHSAHLLPTWLALPAIGLILGLLTLHSQPSFNRWLVPMAGGPNSPLAIKLLPALITLRSKPQIRLTQVFKPSKHKPDMSVFEKSIRHLMRRCQLSSTVVALPVQANSVAEGVINLVKTEG